MMGLFGRGKNALNELMYSKTVAKKNKDWVDGYFRDVKIRASQLGIVLEESPGFQLFEISSNAIELEVHNLKMIGESVELKLKSFKKFKNGAAIFDKFYRLPSNRLTNTPPKRSEIKLYVEVKKKFLQHMSELNIINNDMEATVDRLKPAVHDSLLKLQEKVYEELNKAKNDYGVFLAKGIKIGTEKNEKQATLSQCKQLFEQSNKALEGNAVQAITSWNCGLLSLNEEVIIEISENDDGTVEDFFKKSRDTATDGSELKANAEKLVGLTKPASDSSSSEVAREKELQKITDSIGYLTTDNLKDVNSKGGATRSQFETKLYLEGPYTQINSRYSMKTKQENDLKNQFKLDFKIDQFSFSDTDSKLLFDYKNTGNLTSLVKSIFRFSIDPSNLDKSFNDLDIEKRVIILMCLIQNKQFVKSADIFKKLVEEHLFLKTPDFTVDQWLESVGTNDKRLQFYFKLQTDHSPIDADLFNNVQYYIPKILQGLVPSSFVTQSGINDFRVSSLSIIKALLEKELSLLNMLHSQIVEKTINGDFNGIYIERSLNNEVGIKFRKDTISDLVKLDGIEEEKINTNPVLCELSRVYIDYFKYSRLENISLNKMHIQERIDILKNSLSAENGVFGFFEKIQNDLLACIKDQFGYDVDVTGVIYRVENVVVDYYSDERIQGNLHLDDIESNELMISHSLFRSQSEDLNPKFTNVIPFGAPYDFQSNNSGNYPVTHSKKYQKESPNSTVVISSNSAHSAPKKPQDRIFVGIKVAVK